MYTYWRGLSRCLFYTIGNARARSAERAIVQVPLFCLRMEKQNIYDTYSEQDLVRVILAGNEEAAIYLIYKRYYKDLRWLCKDCYGSHEYIDDLCQEVYVLLKGKNADWQPLTTWTGLSSFRTWFNRVVQHMFLKKRDFLIGSRENKLYSAKEDDVDPVEEVEANQPSQEDYMTKVLLLESINKLTNQDQKLVILKELQGYSHGEIATILNNVRRAENRIKLNKEGHEILADATSVDVLKQRAIAQIKLLLRVNKK